MRNEISRRDFGRIAGLGLGGAVLIPGYGQAHAAARTWKVTGRLGTGLGGFDTTMKTFMQERGVSCGSLAVVRKGRLLAARGYTWSDDTALSTSPTSLFRLASLSKPVTAAAVLKLVQDGKLSLDAPVTSLLALAPPAGGTADPRLGQVTVRRLLQHTGGWDSGISADPMFSNFTISRALGVPLPITKANIAAHTTGRPLDHAPGSTYAYSNYGYMLLGLIIEKAGGLPYRDYVQQKILTPLGITRMRLGRTLKPHAAAGEVPYNSQYTAATVFDASGTIVPGPYGTFNLENMDAHGGWLGTAVDMVRFAGLFDAAGTVLNSTSLSRAFAEPETGVNANGWYYGCGWQVRPVTGGRNTWHTGSLSGTYTVLIRRSDGISFAALFNQRDDASGKSYAEIDSLLNKAANAVTTWPTTDLYSQYF
ncbi:serine hydrolase domain-containing protein [Actinomadura sp. 21ATH]|uniref:serine hydrolase domain-containing protein n=1 Tax=Actinomadura sp. 21ATH TaxID=1735444 RepID=UPI0035C26A73